jgi:DNA processing protein
VKFDCLNELQTSEPDFAKLSKETIKTSLNGVYNKVKALFASPDYRAELIARYEKEGIFCVTYFSDDYPQRLREIPVPPLVLYGKGKRALLREKFFCVVGSRHTSPYGTKQATSIAKDLCDHFAVITGIADGADSAVLEGAIPSGKAVCVLAGGFNEIHPATSVALVKEVEKNGLVLTEHLPETKPLGWMFPVRNRILAGIAEGTLVVSAGRKSGALITAGYCLEYGRELFAFPYNIQVESGVGCNDLIKKGAYLTENILDIGQVFGLNLNRKENVLLSPVEKKILAYLKEQGEAHVNQLAKYLNCQPFELSPYLAALEVKNCVARLGSNRWAIV